MTKNTLLVKITKAGVITLCLWLAGSTALTGQKKIAPSLVRDTVYHKSGLTYYGKIIAHTKAGRTTLRKVDGWAMQFDGNNIDSISWSEKSRLKFIDEIVDLSSFATVDVVYLKDGSILRGEMLAYEQGKPLRFQLKSATISIEESDIERIVQEPEDPLVRIALEQQKKPRVYAFREKGMYSTLTFALLPGGGDYRSELGFGLQASAGYQLRRQLGVGLGVALDSYASTEAGDLFLPVFAEARGYLWKKHNTPYWVVAAGYGFPVRREIDNQEIRRFEGGYVFHPAVGYRFGANKILNWTVDVGYKFQKAVTEREFFFSGDIITREVLYRRLSLRMSVIF